MGEFNPVSSILTGLSVVVIVFVSIVIFNALSQVPGMPVQGQEVLNQSQQGLTNFVNIYFGMPPLELIPWIIVIMGTLITILIAATKSKRY